MTERLADISARIEGIHQLGAVVNAMKGIAAARARVARTQVNAVDSYAATIASAILSVIGANSRPLKEKDGSGQVKVGLLVFCAEQGFAGAFSERVLDSIDKVIETKALFLIGTRGLSIAAARGLAPAWSAAMPSHTPNIPMLADGIIKAIYRKVADGSIERLDVLFTVWNSGRPSVARQTLFPIDLTGFNVTQIANPLIQIPVDILIESLSADYFHASVCKAALHAFAAENEARMEAMSAAGSQIARELDEFQATLRQVRQEAITAEIIELGTGAASQSDAKHCQSPADGCTSRPTPTITGL